MSLRPLAWFGDALRVRAVRNRVRQFMTDDPRWITPWRQFQWYLKVYLPGHRNGQMTCWLAEEKGQAIGYGFLRQSDERWWVTGGIVYPSRGVGYGRLLFAFLTTQAVQRGGEAWLKVLWINKRARNLYDSLGYEQVSSDGPVLVMRYPKAPKWTC